MPPALGETYVMCEDCGARLYSEDNAGYAGFRAVKCRYKRDENGQCVTHEERPDLY